MTYRPDKDKKRLRLMVRLAKLLKHKDRIADMQSCHVVEHGFRDMSDEYAPTFYGDKDKLCCGLGSAANFSGGFALIKQGLMLDVEEHLRDVRSQLDHLDEEYK